jgi:hypothetical protein
MRAIDFQVRRGTMIVAGPSTRTIATDWDAAGWSGKLDAAVCSTSSRFVGPLASPREPWHYTYAPAGMASRSGRWFLPVPMDCTGSPGRP